MLRPGVYASPLYHLEFRHPPEWTRLQGYDERCGGDGGFVQVLGLGGPGWTVDDAAEHIASHVLRPYGSAPTIESIMVDGVDARLILPSADQAPEMRRESALVIGMPTPVEIGGHSYHFVQVVADAEHVRAVASSLRFID